MKKKRNHNLKDLSIHSTNLIKLERLTGGSCSLSAACKIKKMKKISLTLMLIFSLTTSNYSPIFASGPLLVTDRGIAVTYGSSPLVYRFDKGNIGILSNSDATSIIESLFADWESVSTANIKFQSGNPLLLNSDINASNFQLILDAPNPLGYTPVIFDDDGSIVDALLGSGSNKRVLGFAGPNFLRTDDSGIVRILESQAVFNGKFINGIKTSDDPELSLNVFKSTIKHEFGHAFGLDHSQINVDSLNQGAPQSLRDATPLMFPIAVNDLFDILRDDKSSVSLLYPNSSELNNFGSIEGALFRSNGTTKIYGANIIARNINNPIIEAVSCISGYLGNSSDFKLFALPPGDYKVEIEPIHPRFFGGSSVGHFAEISTDLSFQNPVPHGYYTGTNQPITTDINSALVIHVASGQAVKGINIIGSTILSSTSSSSGSTSSSTSGSTSGSTSSSTSGSTSSSTTGGPVGQVAGGCTCTAKGGVTCKTCQPTCPVSNPHLACLFGQYPDCCTDPFGGYCTGVVYCPASGSTSSSTSGSTSSTSSSTTGGPVGGQAKGCSCTSNRGVSCKSCLAACPASNPYLVCLFGLYPDCCTDPFGGYCLGQVSCSLGTQTSGGSTSSTSSGGSSTSGGQITPISGSPLPYCTGNNIKCDVGTPACPNNEIPACGSVFGFTGELAGPGCTDQGNNFFDHRAAFCRSNIKSFTNIELRCDKENLCPKNRKRFQACRDDKTTCKCVCPFKTKARKHTPACDNEDHPICSGKLTPTCTNPSNFAVCYDKKLVCHNKDTGAIDLTDIVECK